MSQSMYVAVLYLDLSLLGQLSSLSLSVISYVYLSPILLL